MWSGHLLQHPTLEERLVESWWRTRDLNPHNQLAGQMFSCPCVPVPSDFGIRIPTQPHSSPPLRTWLQHLRQIDRNRLSNTGAFHPDHGEEHQPLRRTHRPQNGRLPHTYSSQSEPHVTAPVRDQLDDAIAASALSMSVSILQEDSEIHVRSADARCNRTHSSHCVPVSAIIAAQLGPPASFEHLR